ncbi:hypothetical protein TNCV_3257501 [Trichonephila clavipes]|nr:hypothetical protein TNCV_3257501 [Trichonephila clavipes]
MFDSDFCPVEPGRRAASLLVRLVEGEEKWEAFHHLQNVLPQNRGGTEPNRTAPCMVLKETANDLQLRQLAGMLSYCVVSESYMNVVIQNCKRAICLTQAFVGVNHDQVTRTTSKLEPPRFSDTSGRTLSLDRDLTCSGTIHTTGH